MRGVSSSITSFSPGWAFENLLMPMITDGINLLNIKERDCESLRSFVRATRQLLLADSVTLVSSTSLNTPCPSPSATTLLFRGAETRVDLHLSEPLLPCFAGAAAAQSSISRALEQSCSRYQKAEQVRKLVVSGGVFHAERDPRAKESVVELTLLD